MRENTNNEISYYQYNEARYTLLGSFLDFTRFFYQLRTGREFKLSQPVSRESHFITISKALTKIFNGDIVNLNMNVAPRSAKTELLIHFVAWSLAIYPDSNYIYVSYAKEIAAKQTAIIRDIISLPTYRRYFNVELSNSTAAKDNFETTAGGSVYAVGAEGSITGRGAGIKNCDRFGGCIIIDDIIKPEEALSDSVRNRRNDWYKNTLISRKNDSDKTPVIIIGQRLHEEDLPGLLMDGEFDGNKWDNVILKSLDDQDHPLYPETHSLDFLKKLREYSPYVFSSQYQQSPIPAGGALFKKTWFKILNELPNIIYTFILSDTAETSKTFNDATVFNFIGVYEIENYGVKTGQIGLISLHCVEIWIEPKDLKDEFLKFYQKCMEFSIKPIKAFIEKKSTGTYLVSLLKDFTGLAIIEIERNSKSGSKAERFIQCQPYVAAGLIAFMAGDQHVNMCIEHMSKITANDSHARDDIADTFCDAIKLALIDKSINGRSSSQVKIMQELSKNYKGIVR